MTAQALPTSSRYALGLVLVACLVLGGGTARGLMIDTILQIAVIAASTYAILNLPARSVSKVGIAFFGLVLFSGLLQIVPIGIGLLDMARAAPLLPDVPSLQSAPISLSVGRTIQTVIFALVPIYLFIALSKLNSKELTQLIPFYLIGIICNAAAGFFQYSLGSEGSMSGLLGYDVMVAFFANVNHFSTLLVSSIPFILYVGVFSSRPVLAVFTLVSIMLVLLAAGSRAGILIGFLVIVVSLAALAWRGRVSGIIALISLAAIAAYGYGAVVNVGTQALDPEYGRAYFASTTIRAIRDTLPFGIGYGTFDLIFSHYEPSEAIGRSFVNHAHNDFLEIVLEGGLAGGLMLLFFLVTLSLAAIEAGHLPRHRLAILAIMVVLVHSTVDYPLRTMAVAVAFAFFCALIVSDEPVSRKSNRRPGPTAPNDSSRR